MPWLVQSYSLPATSRSSPRVTIWRRLKRLGAMPMAGGAYVLPARYACVEAIQWLAQEIPRAEGSALIMRVEEFDGLSDTQVIGRFQEARGNDYAELESQVATLEQELTAQSAPDDLSQHHDALDRLRRRYADLARVDYFDCPAGTRIAA